MGDEDSKWRILIQPWSKYLTHIAKHKVEKSDDKHTVLHFTFSVDLPLDAVESSAQIVDIPDANYRAAVEAALGMAPGTPITSADMTILTNLEARNSGISDLTGLGLATNLTGLNLSNESLFEKSESV